MKFVMLLVTLLLLFEHQSDIVALLQMLIYVFLYTVEGSQTKAFFHITSL